MTSGADERPWDPNDPYDPRTIHRSIFGAREVRGMRWPNIDLAALQAVNPDCVGWIFIPRSPISLPIMRGHFDRGYYMKHNFSGEEGLHGQVQMEFRHGGVLSERLTAFIAHNMKDRSMFKSIYYLRHTEYLAEHPAAELLIGDKHYTARWFAGFLHNYEADVTPARFGSSSDYGTWIDSVLERSIMQPPERIGPTPQDRIIACTTCAFYPNHTAWTAYGVLSESPF